jgi:hypothetical protein
VILLFGLSLRIWNTQPIFYAHAETISGVNSIQSPLFESQIIFAAAEKGDQMAATRKIFAEKSGKRNIESTGELAQKLYAIVGNDPIREMVPFIAKRDEKVAAFLVGIAKKESSFGVHSPVLDGQDCHNYWGYKGSAGRGTSMGYACFASAEEAIKIVGDRIEVLVGKQRNTPARMVNTWKCGTDCSQDPGAPGWVSTVALYFNKIVS